MTQDEFNAFCAAQPHATHVVQWGGSDVWKIGGKVFAIGGWKTDHEAFAVVFKVSDLGWEILHDTPGCRPAPYMASRGLKWIQRVTAESLDDDGLRAYIAASYRLAGAGLTKTRQRELGLLHQETVEPSRVRNPKN